MAHTNTTQNYNLPQFLPTDKPAWLVDVNPAYASIDTAIKNASDAAGNAQGDATQALSDAAGANAIATQANSKADGAIASLAENFLDTATYETGEIVIFNNLMYRCIEPVTTPGPWTGSINWARLTVDDIVTMINNNVKIDVNVYNIANYGGTITCIKQGNIVTIIGRRIGAENSLPQGSFYDLAIIDSKYRPSTELIAPGFGQSNSSSAAVLGYTITTSGTIKVYSYTDVAYGSFVVTFVRQ